jgi:hypothetical protein
MNGLLLKLAMAATVGCLFASTPGLAQLVPPVKKAERVEIIKGQGDSATFRLRYDVASEGSHATQAHLHIGNPGTNGGIVVWFCANPPIEAPEGTPECPPSPAELTGDIVAADVQAVEEGEPPVEIIAAGDFEGLQRLIEQSSVYVNVPLGQPSARRDPGADEPAATINAIP